MDAPFRFYIIFHKAILKVAYEKLKPEYLEKYFRFVAVNTEIEKIIPDEYRHLVIRESELPVYNPFMQFNKFCESSVFFHVHMNKETLLTPFQYVGFLHYDMVIDDSFVEGIEKAMAVLPSDKSHLFIFNMQWSYPHLDQIIYLNKWDHIIQKYNSIYGTSHSATEVSRYQIPLYHTYLISKPIFTKMMAFAEWAAPVLFEFMGHETKHFPYHLERLHGVFLLLQTLDGHIDHWIQLSGIEHREGLNDPWQKVEAEKYQAKITRASE
jgi:hypothetical protein